MRNFTQRLLWTFGTLAGTLLAFGVLASSTQYKPYGVADSQRQRWDQIQQAIKQPPAGTPQERPPSEMVPVAYVDQAEHDFGLLDPHTSQQHRFTIQNHGRAPLLLTAGDTSCKCTLSDVGSRTVPAGGSTDVTLTWNTGTNREFYRQYAVVHTNDPNRPEIELGVRGTIRAALAFDVDALSGLSSAPDEPLEASAIVYSQTMDEFLVSDIQCSLPHFTWSIEPCLPQVLEQHQAKAGWRIRLTALPDATAYSTVARVTAEAVAAERSEPLIAELPLVGRTLPRIAFYGAQLYAGEGLDLGVMQRGELHQSALVVRVRGHRRPTAIEVLDVQPSALAASIEPLPNSSNRYRLTITVAADAPTAVFNSDVQHGYVKVGDPQDETVSNWFPVYGAIIDDER